MALTNVVDSSHSMVQATPFDILDTTTVGFYECYLDLNALAADDVGIFRVSRKVGTSGTLRVIDEFPLFGTTIAAGTQKDVCFTPYTCLGWQLKFTFEMITASTRSIVYEVNTW